MRTRTKLIFLAGVFTFLFMFAWPVFALQVVPGLHGYGTDTRAAYGNGQNPTIYVVNTRTATAPVTDSTRNGFPVRQGGLISIINENVDNKMILFEVSGWIDYKGYVLLDNNYVTIAGQSAPSPGIGIRYCMLVFCGGGTTNWGCGSKGGNILMQHMRFRVGDDPVGVDYDARNCIEAYGPNLVLDHNSFAFSTDTNVSFSSGCDNTTFSNNIITEPLANVHTTANHATNVNMSYNPQDIILYNNIMSNSQHRNPRYYSYGKSGARIMWANNLMYNTNTRNTRICGSGDYDFNIVGNYKKNGPNYGSSNNNYYWTYYIDKTGTEPIGSLPRLYIDNFRFRPYPSGPISIQTSSNDYSRIYHDATENKATSPTFAYPTNYIPMDSSKVEAYVLEHAGAWPSARDTTDQRTINDIQNLTGRIVDDMSEVPNGYGTIASNGPISIADRGFPSDPHSDDDGDGYTNLEEWLHCLAVDVEGRTMSGCDGTSSPTPVPGDLNADGRVDVQDLGIFLSNWGITTRPASDLNQDGHVDVIDLGILLGNWG